MASKIFVIKRQKSDKVKNSCLMASEHECINWKTFSDKPRDYFNRTVISNEEIVSHGFLNMR